MPLNAEQQQAVDYLDGPLLVLAGPGTGKTQLLGAKVAHILATEDVNPENILCITFTENGARNMRDRLGTMIGQAAADVNIYTYHAFGSNILERYQNHCEVSERRLENVIDSVSTYKILKSIQDQLSARDILKKTAISDLADTIANAKSARLSVADLTQIADKNLEDSLKISQIASPILQNLVPRMKFDLALSEVYQPLLESLTQFTTAEPITKNIERTANFLVRELSEIIQRESATEKPKVSVLNKWKDRRFERDAEGNYRLKDHIANKKLASLAEIMARYDQELREEGLFDFADMIEEAINVLKTDRGFRLSLSERFQYILLDEFQDTNPSQFELIKLLTDYEKPIVMAVGDDDQAIFEFQGANASNLLDFQNHYNAKVITLLDNYRSSGEILDFSHKVMDQVDDSFAKKHSVNKTLRSMLDLLFGKLEKPIPRETSNISRHEFKTGQDEYFWVAREIKRLTTSGVKAKDIAIIAPKHKYIAPLLPYLKAQDIDIAYEKRSNLLEDAKIHEIITLARLVQELSASAQPAHRWLEILSFPFWQIPPLEVLELIHNTRYEKKSTLDLLASSENPKFQQLATWFADLTAASFETPLELFLNYLIGNATLSPRRASDSLALTFTSPYLSYYESRLSESATFELFENLSTLLKATRDHLKTTQPAKLADFVQMLDDYTEASAQITSTSAYQDSDNSVQIMSAHKSKGLEFEYVFMIAVDDWAWGQSKGNNNLFSLPNNLLQIRHTGATADERLRLLFVAITRAKNHLIMTNSVQDFSGKTVARLAYLKELREEKETEPISPFLPASAQKIQLHHDDFSLETRLESLETNWMSSYLTLTPELKDLLRPRLDNFRLSASDITSFIDVIYAGPQAFYRDKILRAPGEPLTREIALGNLIHATFEQITSQKIDNAAALEFFNQQLKSIPLPSNDLKYLAEQGVYALETSLATFEPILRSEHARAEVNFSAEHLNLDGIPLTGKIDHINIDPEAKTIEIYDFKTGNYHDSKWQSHPTLYKYSLQLGFYKLLLNLSPTYRNYRVEKGHILFVSPDQDGRVYDKVYEYNDSDETELKSLIRAVYHEATTLNFLENPELNLAADKNRTLKDLKAFVALLLSQSLV